MTAPEHDPAVNDWDVALDEDRLERFLCRVASNRIGVAPVMPDRWEGDDS